MSLNQPRTAVASTAPRDELAADTPRRPVVALTAHDHRRATTDDARWRAVGRRDATHDGEFVTAVHTTGIYCRPSCPARHPKRENVRFYDTPDDAERAGFRPCKRCRPNDPTAGAAATVARIRAHIDAHLDEPLTLETLGAAFDLSPTYLQRLFRRQTGMSPREYTASRRLERFKGHVRHGHDVTASLYDAGYGSSSAFYTGAPARLGMTPGRYRTGGAGMTIHFSTAASPLGELLLAATETGICAVRLGDDAATLEEGLRREFPAADITRDDDTLRPWLDATRQWIAGEQTRLDLPLDIHATAFQARVWAALRAIPYGETRSYREIAAAIGQPTASRAVAGACAANPVALTIPCHRVVRENGALGGYRWGIDRKRHLLEQEGEATAPDIQTAD